ncbi:MAG: hypothetical protein U9P71_01940 [Campylobacterota bacterium]|nr:hypothetical protein [Campylobacterota bacterium]
MKSLNQNQIFTFYSDHLNRIGADKHADPRGQLYELIVHSAARLGYSKNIINLWILGWSRTKQK